MEPEKSELPEPWLRGTHTEMPAVSRGVVHALELASEDVRKWCASLRLDEMEARPFGLPAVGFHLRHIARSLDRLLTYAEGRGLSSRQIAELQSEMQPSGTLAELFEEFAGALAKSTVRVRALCESDLEQARFVGKSKLSSTVGGLLVHVAEHTQRHVGRAVTTAKLVVAGRGLEKAPAL